MSSYDPIIEQAAQKFNLDPALIRGIIATESSGVPTAVGKTKSGAVGGTGLMGINPVNFKAYGVTDPNDPAQSINAGAAILSGLLDKYGDVNTALTHYIGGDDQKQWGPQTAAYPGKVLSAAGIAAPTTTQPAAPAVLPGIPAAQAPSGAQSDDAIFSSFAKVGTPASVQQGPQSDDAIFDQFAKGATPQQPTQAATPAEPPGQTAMPAPASSGMVGDFLNAAGHHIMNGLNGGAQLIEHGVNAGVNAVAPGSSAANFTQGIVNSDDAAMRAREQAYQSSVPNNAASYLGAGVGEIIPAVLGGGGSLLAKGADLGSALAARAGITGGLATLARGAGASAGGAALGAGYSGIQPVTMPGDFGAQKLGQMQSGAEMGALTPVVGSALAGLGSYAGNGLASLVRPFTQGGRQTIAANILGQAAEGGPTALNAAQIVPGSTPTLAEATANPGIATLQRTIRDLNPGPFVAQEQQNATSRLSQLGSALGTPQQLEAAQAASRQLATDLGGAVATNGVGPTTALNAILSRPAMAPILRDAEKTAQNTTGSNPFQTARDALAAQRVAQFQGIAGSPQALQAASDARNATANALYSQANAETFPIDSALKTLLARPSMQQAIGRAQKLAAETGQPLKEGVDLPAQTTPSTLLNAQGQPAFSVTTPASQATFSGRALNYIKMGLDDIIGSGAQTGGIVGHEKSALNDTKGDLLNWMDSQSPVYQQARQTYAQMSAPINSMETLQGLNLTDANGAIVPSKLDAAIKSIQASQSEPGISAAKSVTSQQLTALSQLRDTVNADRNAPLPPNLGPQAIGHIQTAITNAMNSGKAVAPDVQSSLQAAQDEILNNLNKQNPKAIGIRSAPTGTAAGDFMGPITLPQQASLQATSAQSLQALQGMNLTDAGGNVTLAKVQNALKSLQKQGLLADPEKMVALTSVRDDLLRAGNLGLGKSAGSATAQNLATQQSMRAALPGKLGALASQLPTGSIGGALGTAAGFGIGGFPGAAVGGLAGAKVGSVMSGLMNTHNDAIQDALTQLLMNPAAGGAALNRASSGALPFMPVNGLQRLMYPGAIGIGAGNNSGGRQP